MKKIIYGKGDRDTLYPYVAIEYQVGENGGIHPMREDEAKDWAMEHLEGDDYEAIFGEVEE